MLPTPGTKVSMWGNFLMAAFGAAQQSGVLSLIPGQYSGYVLLGAGLLNGILHMSTGNTPVVPVLGAKPGS